MKNRKLFIKKFMEPLESVVNIPVCFNGSHCGEKTGYICNLEREVRATTYYVNDTSIPESIVIKSNMDAFRTVGYLLHECGHALMHTQYTVDEYNSNYDIYSKEESEAEHFTIRCLNKLFSDNIGLVYLDTLCHIEYFDCGEDMEKVNCAVDLFCTKVKDKLDFHYLNEIIDDALTNCIDYR